MLVSFTGITREILKSELCSSHSERILSMQYNTHPNSSSWSKMCNNTELLEKANAGNLSIVDVINCYRPRCESSDEYKTLQCYNLSQQSRWCWCSGPTGLYIEDTFTQGQTDSLRATCSKSKLYVICCIMHGCYYNDSINFTVK